MKICIMGPITTRSYYGGVAIFDEGLAKGFKEMGHQVVVYTSQKEEAINLTGIPVKKVSWNSVRKLFKEDNPDVVIASLQYAKYLSIIQTSAKKIYFLHGFFNSKSYGYFKCILAAIYQKYLVNLCDMIYANSYFTAMINEEMFRIKSDKVIHIGVGDTILNNVSSGIESKKNKTIFFAGRLVPAKGIEKILEALKILNSENIEYKMIIAGTGSLKSELEKTVDEHGLNVEFVGKKSQEEVLEYYKESEIFISLNQSEPFGIVFAEALIFGCKIICPITGGQNEFLKDYPERVKTLESLEPKYIAEAIKGAFMMQNEKIEIKEVTERFRYKNIALKFLEE